MSRIGRLVLLGVPKDVLVGIWTGTSGRSGDQFKGFRGLPIGAVVLVRLGADRVFFVRIEASTIVRIQYDLERGAAASIQMLNPSEETLPTDIDGCLIDATVQEWNVDEHILVEFSVPFSRLMTSADLKQVRFRDVKQLRVAAQTMKHELQKTFLGQLDLTFAFFNCLSDISSLELWTKMMRLMEWLTDYLGDQSLRCLTRQLNMLEVDSFDEMVGNELKSCLVKILYRAREMNDFDALLAAGCRLFPELASELDASSKSWAAEESPVVVQQIRSGSEVDSCNVPRFAPTFDSSEKHSASSKRMEWML